MLKHPNFRLWNGTVDSPNSLSVVEQVTQYNNELTPSFSKVAFQGYTRCKLTPFGQFGTFLPFLAKILLRYDLVFSSRVTEPLEEKRYRVCHASHERLKSVTNESSEGVKRPKYDIKSKKRVLGIELVQIQLVNVREKCV